MKRGSFFLVLILLVSSLVFAKDDTGEGATDDTPSADAPLRFQRELNCKRAIMAAPIAHKRGNSSLCRDFIAGPSGRYFNQAFVIKPPHLLVYQLSQATRGTIPGDLNFTNYHELRMQTEPNQSGNSRELGFRLGYLRSTGNLSCSATYYGEQDIEALPKVEPIVRDLPPESDFFGKIFAPTLTNTERNSRFVEVYTNPKPITREISSAQMPSWQKAAREKIRKTTYDVFCSCGGVMGMESELAALKAEFKSQVAAMSATDPHKADLEGLMKEIEFCAAPELVAQSWAPKYLTLHN